MVGLKKEYISKNVLNIALIILAILILILLFLLFKGDNSSNDPNISLVIVEENIVVKEGNNASLFPYVENVSKPNIAWSSSNPDVASVNGKGIITAYKMGMAIVTAEYVHVDGKTYYDSCIVNVIASSDVLVTGVSFISEDLVISRNSQLQLQPIISPSNASYEKMTYSSSDDNVVSVTNNGLLTTKKVGEASVVVTVDGKHRGEITVNVVNEIGISDYVTFPYQLSFGSNTMSLIIGDTYPLDYHVSPRDASDKYLTWESSNPNVVSVSNGVAKAISVGESTITVKSLNGVSSKINVMVVTDKISVMDVSLTAYETELKKGETLQLYYKVYPVNATNKKVSFTSSNPSIAMVSENGLITAKGNGNANISVATIDGNHTRTVPITVTSSGGSAKCDDGSGPKPNGVCSGGPTITLNGGRLSSDQQITMNVGETITIKVNLPTNNGPVTLLTRTSASGETGWTEYFSAHSSPSVNRYNCATAVRTSSYNWVITAKKSTSRYITLSQTAEMQTTQCSFVKPMIRIAVKVN